MTYNVFAYGTLRRGFANHALLSHARFVGVGKTKGRYALYVSVIPYAIRDEQVAHLRGEVYEVDEATLDVLDELEEHPHVYHRASLPYHVRLEKPRTTYGCNYDIRPAGIGRDVLCP